MESSARHQSKKSSLTCTIFLQTLAVLSFVWAVSIEVNPGYQDPVYKDSFGYQDSGYKELNSYCSGAPLLSKTLLMATTLDMQEGAKLVDLKARDP